MSENVQQYLRAMREDVVAAAEAKLGRVLTSEEKAGVNALGGMMLEACSRSYMEDADYSAEQVSRDLSGFAEQATPEEQRRLR